MKKSAFTILSVSFILFFGCNLGNLSQEIKIKNSTASNVIIESCDKETSETSWPVDLPSENEKSFKIEGLHESVDFKIKYKNQNYTLGTEYIHDNTKITIELTEDNSELKASKTVGGKTKEAHLVLEN